MAWPTKPIDTESTSLMDKISTNVYYRKIYHFVGGGLILCGLILLDRNWFIALALFFILAQYLISKRITFATIGILFLLIITDSIFVTLTAGIIWLVGDGLAGMIGAAFGKRKWPWHPQKTMLGSAAFLIGACLAVMVVLVRVLDVPIQNIFVLGLVASLGAGIVEMLPINLIKDRKVDDNLLVILTGGLFVQVLSIWLGISAEF